MYTWSFVVSIVFIIYATVCGLITPDQNRIKKSFSIISKIAIVLIICLTLANTISVFIECGPYLCPSDPNSYWLFELFSK